MALGAIVITMNLWAGTAWASVHPKQPDATPACNYTCYDLSNLMLGTDQIQNAYVYGDYGTGGKVGQNLNLKLASNSHPNEDFAEKKVGDLAAYCGKVIARTSYVCLRYPPAYPVFESDWAPYGNESGLCAGVSVANTGDEPVTLQRCGVSAKTLWVGDMKDSTTCNGDVYTPWVNAADRAFSHPLVLTIGPQKGRPWRKLLVDRLDTLTGGVVKDSQEFTIRYGPVA